MVIDMIFNNKNIIRSLILVVLFICAIVQTGMLWLDGSSSHNFFYYFSEKKLYNSNSPNLIRPIRPSRVVTGDGDNSFKYIFDSKSIENVCDKIVKNAVDNSKAENLSNFVWKNYINSKCAVYEFDTPIPFNEYLMSVGAYDKHMTEFIKNFKHMVFVFYGNNAESGDIYFVSDDSEPFKAVKFSTKISNDVLNSFNNTLKDFSDNVNCISTALSGFNIFTGNIFIPQFGAEQFDIKTLEEEKCIDLYKADEKYIELVTEQYFNKYSNKNVTTEPSGIYTISDSDTVVKCYPSGVLEYFSYKTENSKNKQTLSSAYYVCDEFLRKDTSIKTGYYLSDIKITGEGVVFCFDYYLNSMPIIMGNYIKDSADFEHAIEVVVNDNNVRKFKKYNSNFNLSYSKNTINVDFLTAVNYAMALEGKNDYNIDSIELGYYLTDKNTADICWFVKLNSSVYIINAITNKLVIK